jgi:hypothetical protein
LDANNASGHESLGEDDNAARAMEIQMGMIKM